MIDLVICCFKSGVRCFVEKKKKLTRHSQSGLVTRNVNKKCQQEKCHAVARRVKNTLNLILKLKDHYLIKCSNTEHISQSVVLDSFSPFYFSFFLFFFSFFLTFCFLSSKQVRPLDNDYFLINLSNFYLRKFTLNKVDYFSRNGGEAKQTYLCYIRTSQS